MSNNKSTSDLSIKREECPKCGAVWLDGKHVWATGKPGNEDDLAGLVCNKFGDETCINPKSGSEIGDTWEKRMESMKNNNPLDQF